MMKGEQQKIYQKGSNRKINAFITLLYPSNKIKFKISKSRTSTDFIDHLRNIENYIKKNKIKRFILVTDNASFHVSRQTKQFIDNQLDWLTVISLSSEIVLVLVLTLVLVLLLVAHRFLGLPLAGLQLVGLPLVGLIFLDLQLAVFLLVVAVLGGLLPVVFLEMESLPVVEARLLRTP